MLSSVRFFIMKSDVTFVAHELVASGGPVSSRKHGNILSYLILSYLILSYLILSYLILSYLILSYLILSWAP